MPPRAPSSLVDESYVLPTVEALFAGTLALMTGCAQDGGDPAVRALMAGKVVSNLERLSTHADLSPAMRRMLTQLSTRWSGPGLGARPASSHSAWAPAPTAIQ
jgi:hypothetical protein